MINATLCKYNDALLQEQRLQPKLLKWATDNSLPGSMLHKLVATQILHTVSEGMVSFEFYALLVKDHPDMMYYMARAFAGIVELSERVASNEKFVFREERWNRPNK